ncbi:adhesion G protein-coupled receptor B2 [Trichonephila clavipes]|nr:adhesion G protein-coupled receptor B2 [Trichonephila clavipes]
MEGGRENDREELMEKERRKTHCQRIYDYKTVQTENIPKHIPDSLAFCNLVIKAAILAHFLSLVALHFKYDFWHMTATAGSDVVQSGRPIFDDFFQHLWPYIGNNTANVVFQMVKRLCLIRIDQ